MTANDYQIEALRTSSNYKYAEQLSNCVMGLTGEAGECADMVKKHLYQGHGLDKRHLAKELGDVAWYLAIAAYTIGYDLETVLQMNVDKLRARYPGGFDVDKSVNRQEGDV